MRFQKVIALAVLALAVGTVSAQPTAPRPFPPTSWQTGEPTPPAIHDPNVIGVGYNPNPPTFTEPPLLPAGIAPRTIPYQQYKPERCDSFESPCTPFPRVWGGAEYLLWWLKDANVPALVTTGPASSGGIIGAPGTTVAFGGASVNLHEYSGVRFTAGFWLDECQTIGVEGSYFTLGSRSVSFVGGNDGAAGSPLVARPFFNAIGNREDSELVAFPGVLAGTVRANLDSRLDGAELNALFNLCSDCCSRLDLIAGLRYLELNEGVNVLEDLTVLPGVPGLGGSHFLVGDGFHARSAFYASQFGARAQIRRGNWDAVWTGKLALGGSHEEVTINGSTGLTSPGLATVNAPGGLLALPSNLGVYKHDTFAVAPEFGLSVGYQVTRAVRASVGYNFLYWSNVVRAGDQIDRVLSTNQIPSTQPTGAATSGSRPAFAFHDADFWAQGLTFAVEWRY